MEKLAIFGNKVKTEALALEEDFPECGWFLDTIYEYLEEVGLDFPREGAYEDEEVNKILDTIYAKITAGDISDLELGTLVYSLL